MKSKYLLVFTLIIGLTILSELSCGFVTVKPKMEEYPMTEELRNLIPFHGGEKVFLTTSDSTQFVLQALDRFSSSAENDTDNYQTETETIWIKNDTTAIVMQVFGRYFETNRATLHIRMDGSEYLYFPPLEKGSDNYLDSLFVIDRWIRDVWVSEKTYQEFTSKLYYSTEYGVLVWERADGMTWELEKIEW